MVDCIDVSMIEQQVPFRHLTVVPTLLPSITLVLAVESLLSKKKLQYSGTAENLTIVSH